MESAAMEIHEAGCACNSIRYRFTGKPYTVYACHCTRCQSRTGSAFGMTMQVPSDGLELLEGCPVDVSIKSGGPTFQYCEKCRALIFLKSAPDITCIFPGCFDDNSWFKPVANVWVRSAQPWVFLDKNLKSYETQPDSWMELYDI
jgi:hypothetical protein